MGQVFSAFGPVRSVSMIPNPDNGKHKGYGFVDFERAESAAQVPRRSCSRPCTNGCAAHSPPPSRGGARSEQARRPA